MRTQTKIAPKLNPTKRAIRRSLMFNLTSTEMMMSAAIRLGNVAVKVLALR
jgi:hypothetical protein